MRRPVLLDAPSNLGLRPPSAGAVPGCYRLPEALRQQDLLARLGATDGGVVTPPPYTEHGWRHGDGVRHARQIARYTRQLADRVTTLLDQGAFPVLLGGDCSILFTCTAAMRPAEFPPSRNIVDTIGTGSAEQPVRSRARQGG